MHSYESCPLIHDGKRVCTSLFFNPSRFSSRWNEVYAVEVSVFLTEEEFVSSFFYFGR